MKTTREETGEVTDSMLLGKLPRLEAENDTLKAENTALNKEKLKLKNRITQLESIVTDLKAAALKKGRKLPPE